jgi:leucine dehydrogenase
MPMASTIGSELHTGDGSDVLARMTAHGHEQVVFVSDPASGYRGILAIHSTRLGPALGGTRLWSYATEDAALTDALRLSEGMTYKAAAAGVPFGGGKAVVVADSRHVDRPALFRAHGRAVESLGGRYITSVDIGTSPDDMRYVREETTHVGGLPSTVGDPSPATAHGVQRAIEAALYHVRGTSDLAGRTVAIQGCGHVGYHLARMLHGAGARLIASDTNDERASRVAREFGAEILPSEAIHTAKSDVFAPCAFGAGLSPATIPDLRCAIVAGAANNQLLSDTDGALLEQHSIAYAPDFIANAGGLIYLCQEVAGWSAERVTSTLEGIFDTMSEVFAMASARAIPSSEAAVRIARDRLAARPPTASDKPRPTARS